MALLYQNQDMLQISRWLGRFWSQRRRNDGKQDSGDALELTVRVTEDAKPEMMRQIARQLVHEASNGEQLPAWVQTFMSPAGWEHYSTLREEAGYPDQAALAP